jgi:hypothetical protein
LIAKDTSVPILSLNISLFTLSFYFSFSFLYSYFFSLILHPSVLTQKITSRTWSNVFPQTFLCTTKQFWTEARSIAIGETNFTSHHFTTAAVSVETRTKKRPQLPNPQPPRDRCYDFKIFLPKKWRKNWRF